MDKLVRQIMLPTFSMRREITADLAAVLLEDTTAALLPAAALAIAILLLQSILTGRLKMAALLARELARAIAPLEWCAVLVAALVKSTLSCC